MLPTYILSNLSTGKRVALTNARLAHRLYREIMLAENVDYFAYSTFVAKVKAKPLRFLNWSVEFVRRYGIQEVENSELLKYLNSTDELAKQPKPLVLNVKQPASTKPPTVKPSSANKTIFD